MTSINAVWAAHQRKRFMRPDARRWMSPMLREPSKPSDDVETLKDAAAKKAARAELLALKPLVSELKFYLALRRFSRKYREDQPRDDHGRWVDDGGRRRRVRLAAGDRPTLGPEAFAAIGLEVVKRAIEAYRSSNNLLDLFGSRIGTVAMTTVGDQQIFGSNSTSPTYTSVDRAAANSLREVMVDKYPNVMNTEGLGQKPNDAIYHAETTVLLRAARANGGTLAGQSIEVHADRTLCGSCEAVLPYVGLELGNPTVTFVGPNGLRNTIRNGSWIDRGQ